MLLGAIPGAFSQITAGSSQPEILANCGDAPSTTAVLKVVMGEIIDYFKPSTGNTVCEMVNSNNKHMYSSDKITWHTPTYASPNIYLGSKRDWPLSIGETRKWISQIGHKKKPKGCCYYEKDGPVIGWGCDFTAFWEVNPENVSGEVSGDGSVVINNGILTAAEINCDVHSKQPLICLEQGCTFKKSDGIWDCRRRTLADRCDELNVGAGERAAIEAQGLGYDYVIHAAKTQCLNRDGRGGDFFSACMWNRVSKLCRENLQAAKKCSYYTDWLSCTTAHKTTKTHREEPSDGNLKNGSKRCMWYFRGKKTDPANVATGHCRPWEISQCTDYTNKEDCNEKDGCQWWDKAAKCHGKRLLPVPYPGSGA